MVYEYKSVTPIASIRHVWPEAVRVATTRHPDHSFGLEPVSEQELDSIAACALGAGHDVQIVVVRNVGRRAEVADLYVL